MAEQARGRFSEPNGGVHDLSALARQIWKKPQETAAFLFLSIKIG